MKKLDRSPRVKAALLEGMRDAFDLTGTPDYGVIRDRPTRSDRDALRGDFAAVGRDMWSATRQITTRPDAAHKLRNVR